MSSNKKVLVVSHNAFSKVLNNGKTMESIFKEYSKSDLAQVFFSKNENPDFDFCENYFKITDTDVLQSLIKGYAKCGTSLQRPPIETDLINANGQVKSNRLFNFIKSKVEYITPFRDLLWTFGSWKTKEFLNWCEDYNPGLIFFVGGNFGFSHKIACFLSEYLKIPLVTYFTDDYLIYPKNRNFIDAFQKMRMKRFYRKTVQQSSLCFAIGDIMAAEYTGYFGKQFFPIMNSIEKEPYIPYLENQEINFSYFGGLHLNRWKMLVRLAKSLSNASINVYSMQELSQEIADEFKDSGIVYKGGVSGMELKKMILKSDILLHVESDDKFNQSLTKLSVSTKIPEYLMSGRLVVGYGPKDVASMKVLSDNGIGIVLDSSSLEDSLTMQLFKIISDFELRRKIGLLGYNYAIENYDNVSISKNFKQKLESI